MKPVTPTASYPSSIQTTTPHTGDAQQRILIASFVGVAVILVMILLFAIYCYNKRHPIPRGNNYIHGHTEVSGTPSSYVYVNKGLQCVDHDSTDLAHDVSIKLKIQWDDMYINSESEKFKTLQDQIIESMEELYKQYCEFRGAILLKLRKGSVIADIRLKFSKLAVEPLLIIKDAVAHGKCSSLEVERDYFYLKERRSRQSRSDKTESGYGSQVFENLSFVEKSHEGKVDTSPDNSPKSTSELAPNIDFVPAHSKIESPRSQHSKDDMDGWSSSHQVKTKKKVVTNVEDQIGHHFIARFDFQPQDYRELALHQGDLVRISCTDVGGWVKVVNSSGEEGWVPRNFIVEIGYEDYVNRKKAVESIIFLDQMIESAADVEDGESDEANASPEIKIKLSEDVVDRRTITPEVFDAAYENVNNCVFSEESLNGLFVAIFPFDPTDHKELRLEVGDMIDVSRTSETGWWKGCCLRTNTVGWFPSTYVKPKSAEINFQSFFGDLSHVEESVSDSELHNSAKRSPMMNGYYSDSEENKVQEKFMLRGSASENSVSFDDDDMEDSEGLKKDGMTNSVQLLHSSGSFPQSRPPAPKRTNTSTSVNSEIMSYYSNLENDVVVNPAEPPAKPVPPKPRKQHMKQTYQELAAKGQLYSTNDMLSRSLESLRIRSKSAGRRFSEDVCSTDEEGCKKMFLRPIEKDRPLSFQGAPRFVQLANRYASNMKGAWSLPSLNGDQIKLSPDDDRPYLDPIPRKNKTSSVELLDSQIRSGDVTTDEYIELTPNPLPERAQNTESEDVKSRETVSLVISNENGVFTPKIDGPVMKSNEPPPKPERESLKYGFAVRLATNGELKKQKEGTHSGNISEPDKHLPTCTSDDKCECGVTDTKVTDEMVTKSCTRFRNTGTRNFCSFESINEEGESSSKRDVHEELAIDSNVKNCVTGDKEKITDSTSSSLSNDYSRTTFPKKQTIVVDKSQSEPRYSNILLNKESSHTKNKHKLYFRKINSFGEEESEEDTVSRTSSTLSLSSFNSSNASRSTTSSKLEQMNLRRAIMNISGAGKDDLSFKVGAMLYELRPRNKEGLCFGLLEDSTEGWYPAESVEIFNTSLQV